MNIEYIYKQMHRCRTTFNKKYIDVFWHLSKLYPTCKIFKTFNLIYMRKTFINIVWKKQKSDLIYQPYHETLQMW